MERISRSDMLMEMAFTAAKRGTCSRLQVGAIISKDGRVISTGYNGVPAGLPHCVHNHLMLESAEMGCTQAEHAERNAIYYAARYGTALEGSVIHTTHAPCENCARAIINAGIRQVTYTIPYRKTEGIDLLRQAGIDVIEVSIHK